MWFSDAGNGLGRGCLGEVWEAFSGMKPAWDCGMRVWGCEDTRTGLLGAGFNYK